MDARKRMLVILGLGALANAAWVGFFLFLWLGSFALEGSRAGAQDEGIAVLAMCWPLIEAVITFVWVALSKRRYGNSKYRAAGNVIALATLILTPTLYFWALSSGTLRDDFFYFYIIMLGIPFFGHWTARILWMIPKEQAATAASF